MRNFLFLIGLLPIFASAQGIPERLLERFPILEELQQSNPAGSPDEYLLNAQYGAVWDGQASSWMDADSTEYYYNEYGEWEEIIHLNWDGDAWEYNYRVLHTYIMDTLRATSTTQSWDGTNWVQEEGNTRSIIAYDEAGNETSVEMLYWNGDDWSPRSGRYTSYIAGTDWPDTVLHKWEMFEGEGLNNFQLEVYELYNSNGDPVIYYDLFWNAEVEAWGGAYRYSLTYNSNGDLVQRILERQQVNQEWEPLQREFYTYDEEGKSIERLIQNYDGQSWQDMRRYSYEYDAAGQLVVALLEEIEPISETWQPFLRATYEYDENGNVVYFQYQIGSEGVLVNLIDIRNTYYEDIQQQATEKIRSWIEGEWINMDSTTFYYQLFTETEEKLLVQKSVLEIFPNPARRQVHLKVRATELQGEGVMGTLYNNTGKVVRHFTLGQEFEQLSLFNLPPGTYWLKVSNGVHLAVQAVVVQ